jgi:F0F1-type ATP synthase epsilon subunit
VYELRLTVLGPGGKLLEEERVDWVRVQLVDGGIGIWPGHAPLLAETISAPLVYARNGEEHRVDVRAGILQIETGGITILTGGDAGTTQDEGQQARRFDRLARVLLAQLRQEPEEAAREPRR